MRVVSAGPAGSADGSETATSPTAKKRRKSYARRTCQSCRARKQRCEFPEASLLVAPSDKALQEHLACLRCRALDVPCLLNDFERGARLEVERDGHSAPEGQAAPRRRRRSRAQVRGPPAEQGEPNNGVGNKDESQHNDDVAKDQVRKLADAHPKDVDQVEEFFNRRRPITILVELVSRQPKFGTALRDSRRSSEVAMEDLVDDNLSQTISDWTEKEVVLWLPFVPSPWSVRLTRRQGQPQQSKVDLVALELLEVVQYAVAAQHMAQVDGPLRRGITVAAQTIVENGLGPLMLSSPSSVEAAQALQLLAAFPVVFGDPGPVAGVAKRMSLASQRTANLNYKFRDGTFADIEADLESYVFFCSACVWDDVYSYGSDDYFVFHKSDWLLKENKIIEHLEELSRRQTRRGGEGSAGERRRNLGKMCVLLRALCMAYAAKSWVSTDAIELGGDPVARTQQLDVCLEAWQYDMSLFRARLEQHLGSYDGRDQESVADDEERRCRQRMLDWLIVESSTAHLTISAKVFVRACEADITPNYIRNLIFGIDVHDAVRLFSFKHGDPRMDACETVMATMTRMATLATEQGARAQDKDHSLYPSALVSGYLLQAATLAMDMFSTSLKFFKSMPRRADSWRLAFGGAVRFAEALTRTPIEEGGTAAASAKIVAGMLDIIAIWERALMASRVAGGATPSSSATAASGGRSAGTTSSSDGRDVHHIPAPTAAAAAAAPLSASTDHTSGESSDTPATTAPPMSIFDSLEPNEWSQFGTLSSSDGIHATLWNTDTLQTMMNDVFGRTDWGDVLAELEGENLSMFPGLAS